MKEIKNYENYIVSKDGRIYNKITSKKLKAFPDTRGYLQVKLYNNGKGVTKKVHRLVAETYLLNIENKPQINHIDGIKNNNKLDNLAWISCTDNMRHSWEIGLRDHCRRVASKIVVDTQTGVFYNSAKELARLLNMRYQTLIFYLNNDDKNKTNYKYV